MKLRLDIDRGHTLLQVGRLAWLLRRAGYRLLWLSQTRSPGGSGWHLEAQTDPDITSAVEVTALQAVCGSDPAREACNLTRARHVDAAQHEALTRALEAGDDLPPAKVCGICGNEVSVSGWCRGCDEVTP